jgi:hypothetical protein
MTTRIAHIFDLIRQGCRTAFDLRAGDGIRHVAGAERTGRGRLAGGRADVGEVGRQVVVRLEAGRGNLAVGQPGEADAVHVVGEGGALVGFESMMITVLSGSSAEVKTNKSVKSRRRSSPGNLRLSALKWLDTISPWVVGVSGG